MTLASRKDKAIVVKILSESFRENQSVIYVIKKGYNSDKYLRRLVQYSFEICYRFGKIYLNNDKTCCSLVLFPENKKTTFCTIYLDFKLVLFCIGIKNLYAVIKRELLVKQKQLKVKGYYVWFIGAFVKEQHKGRGSEMLSFLLQDCEREKRTIFLETSTERNLPWYKKFGFIVYDYADFGYRLFFLKR